MAGSARGLAQRAVKTVAAGADAVRRPPPGVVVLIYHRVGGGSGGEVDLPADRFEAQIELLAERAWVTTLEEALQAVRAHPEQPPHEDQPPQPAGPARAAGDAAHEIRPRVVVTFDDGTADFADVAVPILARHGVPATLYVATDFVERGRPFPGDAPPVSWAALADALSTNVVAIGSHTHRHRLLDRLPVAAVIDELDRSIDLIGTRLGRAPADFAYPKAVAASGPAEAEVRARFRSAALAGTRANPYGATDVHRLARSPVQRSDGMRWFERKASGGMAFEDALRRLANRRRYASATT